MGKLTAAKAKSITEPGRYGDGNGLYLRIAPGGSKQWVLRIVVHGKRRDISCGPYPAVSLAQARHKARHVSRRRCGRTGPISGEKKSPDAIVPGGR